MGVYIFGLYRSFTFFNYNYNKVRHCIHQPMIVTSEYELQCAVRSAQRECVMGPYFAVTKRYTISSRQRTSDSSNPSISNNNNFLVS